MLGQRGKYVEAEAAHDRALAIASAVGGRRAEPGRVPSRTGRQPHQPGERLQRQGRTQPAVDARNRRCEFGRSFTRKPPRVPTTVGRWRELLQPGAVPEPGSAARGRRAPLPPRRRRLREAGDRLPRRADLPARRRPAPGTRSATGSATPGGSTRPRKRLRESLTRRERLAADVPAVASYRQDLGRSRSSLALCCVTGRSTPKPKQLYRQALPGWSS